MSRLMGTKQVVLVLFILMLCLGIGVNYAYANEPEAGTPGNTISSGSISWQNPLMAPTEQQRDKQYTILSTIEANGRAELKSAIEQEFTQRLPSFSIHYIGDTSNIKVLLYEVIDEILDADDYLKYSVGYYNAKYTYSPNEATIEFAVSYVNTREQEDYVEQQVLIILAQIITPEMSPLKKVKTINDYIVLNSQYSDTTNDPNINAHSAYALLKEGQGVCQGYALLTYKMLEQAGLPVHIISGSAGGGPHAWNLVQLNDNWYHLDVTWNDPLPNSPGQVNYNYFLRNNTISDDHSWDTPSYPAATDSSFAYFHVMRDASSQGDNIFFSHEADENYLYRSSIDGTGLQKINNNRSFYITAAGNWIYYSNYSYGGYLFKIRNNGTDESVVVEEHAINTYVRDNILYYTHVVSETTSIDKSIPLTTYAIATSAEPEEGGTVSGAGTYLDGDIITLTATPNAGYDFVNWTEDGNPVSEEASYSFTVSSDRTLVAVFAQKTPADVLIHISSPGSHFSTTVEDIYITGYISNYSSATISSLEFQLNSDNWQDIKPLLNEAGEFRMPVTIQPGNNHFEIKMQFVSDITTATSHQISGEITLTIDECFIATACFGSKYEPAVVLLRNFRDDFLMKTSWGRAFVNFYYHTSPPYAAQIADSPGLKEFTRVLLLPFIALVYLLYHPLLATTILFALLVTFIHKRRNLITE